MASPTLPVTPPAPGAAQRIAAVDGLRGGAVALMVAYHGLWDATYLGLIDLPLLTAWPWLAARATILSLFLGLAGLSLTLGHGAGLRWPAFRRRLAQVGGAAAAITAATMIPFPEAYIFFGVLHHIAVASILALGLLRLPWPVLAVVGTAAAVLPETVALGGAFERLPLVALGLAANPPLSVDFVPLLPWFAAWPAGMLLGRRIARRAAAPSAGWSAWQPKGGASRLLVLAGRHSLIVYLVHQLPLMGGLWLVAQSM